MHRHAVYHCLKAVQKPFRHASVFNTRVSVFKTPVFAHLSFGALGAFQARHPKVLKRHSLGHKKQSLGHSPTGACGHSSTLSFFSWVFLFPSCFSCWAFPRFFDCFGEVRNILGISEAFYADAVRRVNLLTLAFALHFPAFER